MKTIYPILVFTLFSTILYSTIINVPVDQPTIQAGIDASVNIDTVLVQSGTYVENINYNGKNITVASLFLTTQDTSYITSTIIDGNQNDSVVIIENGEDSTAVLCGFTITNGLGGGSYPDCYAGGITCSNSSNPNLDNLIITSNSAIHGGGIFCSTSSPSLMNVTMSDNSVSGNGGGIFCFSNSNPSFTYVTIARNTAVGDGGGVNCQYSSSPSLMNVTISENTVISEGGGINCSSTSNPILQNVSITGNTAGSSGGGINLNHNSNLNLINCILWNDSPQEINFYQGNDQNSITISYSDIQGGEVGIVTNNNGTVNWLDGNIDDDPLFVDPFAGDFHLIENSPCIDAGDPASPFDPDGTITDMGAYYFNQYDGPVWHISTTGSDLTGNGTGLYPFSTIQHGIIESSNTDTILVQPGTFIENINYNGKLITVGSLFLTTQDTAYISQTVIDGNENGSVVTFENGEGYTAVLIGFTIKMGSAYFGGGIYCNGSSPSLDNLTIKHNAGGYSSNRGGGICCWNSNPTITNVTISENSSWYGGGIHCYNSNPSLENVTISDNSAYFHDGGGIYCENSSPTLQNVTITGNTAMGYGLGGGIYCDNSSNPSFENVTISSNSAYGGGGIYCRYSSPYLVNVTISGNSASSGGGIHCEYSSPSIENVIITGNDVFYRGGGIYCNYSSPNLVNVTISDNSADSLLANCGGIYCENSSPNLINCILWNDSTPEIVGSVIATYSDIEGGWTGTGNINENPLFVGTGDHPFMLQDLSPCVNAGIPDTTGLNLPEYDLAGNPRVYGGRIDMGAYENQNVVVSIEENLIPIVTRLNQNYPNPFNPTTTINYSLNENSRVSLNIYNIKGQKVKTLVNDLLDSGKHTVIWNGIDDNNKSVASGIYFYKLKTFNLEKMKKMILLK